MALYHTSPQPFPGFGHSEGSVSIMDYYFDHASNVLKKGNSDLTETDKDKLKSSYEYLEVLLRSYLIHESRPGVIAPNFTECVDKCNRALPQRDFYEENSTMSREVYSFFRRGKIDIDHLDYWHTNAEDVYLDFSEAMRIHEWEFKHYDREIIRDLVTSVSTLRHAIKGEEVRESKRQETINFLFRLSSLCRN